MYNKRKQTLIQKNVEWHIVESPFVYFVERRKTTFPLIVIYWLIIDETLTNLAKSNLT
jgi:hypothetical protein